MRLPVQEPGTKSRWQSSELGRRSFPSQVLGFLQLVPWLQPCDTPLIQRIQLNHTQILNSQKLQKNEWFKPQKLEEICYTAIGN